MLVPFAADRPRRLLVDDSALGNFEGANGRFDSPVALVAAGASGRVPLYLISVGWVL